MDLIKYLERAAVEADAFWRFGVAQDQRGPDGSQTEVSFADNAVLAQLLEARPTMICMIVAPDGGDTEETEEAPDRETPSEGGVDDEAARPSEG